MVQKRLGHLAIRTVQDMGWAGIKNGELLRRAEAQFDVLVTADQKVRFQQNLSGKRLAVIVLPTNQVRRVIELLPAIEENLKEIRPGTFVEMPLTKS